MTITDAFLRIHLSGKVSPDATDATASGKTTLARDATHNVTAPKVVFAARVIFSAAAQTADVNFLSGVIVLSASGVRQVETALVTAAAGATSSGNLALTLTAAAVTGSPLAISVALTTAAHTTAAKIAAAIAAKLNATAAVAAHYTATSSGDNVILTRNTGKANDTTLNLAITGSLGVTTAGTSTSTTSGTTGVIVERLGGDGQDIYGKIFPSAIALRALSLSSPATAASFVDSTAFGNILPGDDFAFAGTSLDAVNDVFTSDDDGATVDILAIAE